MVILDKCILLELYNTSISIRYNRHTRKEVWRLAYSEAQKEATARYNKKAYDRIDLVVPKGKRAVIKAFAKSRGMSANGFINQAIDKAMAEQMEI